MNRRRKIVFIINTIPNPRCIKRIDEFIEHGYEVDAYSFIREGMPYIQPSGFQIEIVGLIMNKKGYKGRIKIIIKALKNIHQKYIDDNDVVFYYFGLDIALFGNVFIRKNFFYEESDLPQTYLSNSFIKVIMDWIDKRIIKKSVETVLTSEGFLKYHFESKVPDNISVIPNRINKKCLLLEKRIKSKVSLLNIRIGFVGLIRYKSIINFAKVFSKRFPQYEFHFFGNLITNTVEITYLENLPNVFFHGEFKNPEDLPMIYNSIDLVLSTYDVNVENVLYAEPNKIYESIFFETPIIVSKGTFLSEKVEQLGIGYSIDAMDENAIVEFIDNLSQRDIELKIDECRKLPPSFAIDDNTDFFKKIGNKLT